MSVKLPFTSPALKPDLKEKQFEQEINPAQFNKTLMMRAIGARPVPRVLNANSSGAMGRKQIPKTKILTGEKSNEQSTN